MKDFKKQLIETLLQITILASIYRYPSPSNTNQNYNLNTRDSLLLLNRNRFDFTNNIDYLIRLKEPTENYTYFEELLNRDNFSIESYLNLNPHRAQQNLSVYPAFFEFTDKFLNHSSFQRDQREETLNNNNNLQINENLSEEDMNAIAIDRILFEQDIDLGIGKEFFDNELINNKLIEKNILNDISLKFQKIKEEEEKNDDIITAIQLLDSRLPNGFRIIVEEDTGEIITIPSNDTDFSNNPNVLNVTEIDAGIPLTNQTFTNDNNTAIENKILNSNDNLLDDLLLNNTFNIKNEKLDDSWFKTYLDFDDMTSMLSPPQGQSPPHHELLNDQQLENNNFMTNSNMTATILENNLGIDRQDSFFNTENVDPTLLNSQLADSSFENSTLFTQNFAHLDFENILNNPSEQLFDEDTLAKQLEKFINDIKDFDNTTIINAPQHPLTNITTMPIKVYSDTDSGVESNDETQSNMHSSGRSSHSSRSEIRSTSTEGEEEEEEEEEDDDSMSILSDGDIKKELVEDNEVLFGLLHNHTYLESVKNDSKEQVYHPHSYKNKLKNMLALNNRTTKDEKLIRQYKIDYTLHQIVNSEVEEFNEMLRNTKLTTEQLTVMKDIRRRGKNKIAAQICRKRKIDSIDSLHEDVDDLKKKKRLLESERTKIQDEIKEFTKKIDHLYKDLLGSNQDPNDPIIVYINSLLERFNEEHRNGNNNGNGDKQANSKANSNNKRQLP